MTCKDCIHFGVCDIVSTISCYTDYEKGEVECKDFKPRDRFVELPYKLGDIVYIIFERKIIGCVVRRISFDNTKLGANITLDSLDDNNYGTIYGLLADDDCEIFLTRKEAEAALKAKGSYDAK